MIAESKQRKKVNNDVINNKNSSGAMYSSNLRLFMVHYFFTEFVAIYFFVVVCA